MTKQEICDQLNAILDTDIDWTKLSKPDLMKLVDLIDKAEETGKQIILARSKQKFMGMAEETIDKGIEKIKELLG